jgi:hypothetical protein
MFLYAFQTNVNEASPPHVKGNLNTCTLSPKNNLQHMLCASSILASSILASSILASSILASSILASSILASSILASKRQ